MVDLGTKQTASDILTPNPVDSREPLAARRAARKRFALFARVYYFRHRLFRETTSGGGVNRQEIAARIFPSDCSLC